MFSVSQLSCCCPFFLQPVGVSSAFHLRSLRFPIVVISTLTRDLVNDSSLTWSLGVGGLTLVSRERKVVGTLCTILTFRGLQFLWRVSLMPLM